MNLSQLDRQANYSAEDSGPITASEKVRTNRAIGKVHESMICDAPGCRTSSPAITLMGCRVNKTQIARILANDHGDWPTAITTSPESNTGWLQCCSFLAFLSLPLWSKKMGPTHVCGVCGTCVMGLTF